MPLTLAQAIDIKMDWDKDPFPNRVKTRQVLEAEEMIKNFGSNNQSDSQRLKRKLKLHSQKIQNLIREVELDGDWSENERVYLIGLLNPVKSFYDRYKKRVR